MAGSFKSAGLVEAEIATTGAGLAVRDEGRPVSSKESVMDRQQQHHEQQQKEREHEQAVWKEHNREVTGKRHGVHPAWYVVVAVVFVGAAVLIWTLIW